LADDGTVQSLLGIAEDITARKRIEVALQQTQDQYYSLLQSIDDIVWELDYETWRFTFVSKRAERLLGYPIECWLDEPSFWPDHLHPEDRDRTLEKCVYLSERNENHELEYRMIRADGQIVWFRDVVTVEQRDGRTFRLRGIMLDITDSKEEETLRAGQNGILEMIAAAEPITDILEEIAFLIESRSPETRCGVLLLCEDGIHVSGAVGRNLPGSYKSAVIGRAIGPYEGSCGAAMYYKKRIVVADVHTDPVWEDYRDLAITHGIKASWSTPILTPRGKVLDTFGMHCSESRVPSVAEKRLADVAAQLASVAIESEQVRASLRESEKRFRFAALATSDAIYDFDVRKGVFWRNESFERLYLPGCPAVLEFAWWRDRLSPHDRTRVMQGLENAF
jgi:PAS domain S-box-containing protein